MQQSLQITFRGMSPSAALEELVRSLAQRLDRYQDRITTCHVTIQAPHNHPTQGAPFEIHIRIGTSTNGEINISRSSADDHSQEGPYVAVRDAFHAAMRKLEAELERTSERMRAR